MGCNTGSDPVAIGPPLPLGCRVIASGGNFIFERGCIQGGTRQLAARLRGQRQQLMHKERPVSSHSYHGAEVVANTRHSACKIRCISITRQHTDISRGNTQKQFFCFVQSVLLPHQGPWVGAACSPDVGCSILIPGREISTEMYGSSGIRHDCMHEMITAQQGTHISNCCLVKPIDVRC